MIRDEPSFQQPPGLLCSPMDHNLWPMDLPGSIFRQPLRMRRIFYLSPVLYFLPGSLSTSRSFPDMLEAATHEAFLRCVPVFFTRNCPISRSVSAFIRRAHFESGEALSFPSWAF